MSIMSTFRVWGLGFRDKCLGFRVLRFRVSGFGLGFRALGFGALQPSLRLKQNLEMVDPD